MFFYESGFEIFKSKIIYNILKSQCYMKILARTRCKSRIWFVNKYLWYTYIFANYHYLMNKREFKT